MEGNRLVAEAENLSPQFGPVLKLGSISSYRVELPDVTVIIFLKTEHPVGLRGGGWPELVRPNAPDAGDQYDANQTHQQADPDAIGGSCHPISLR